MSERNAPPGFAEAIARLAELRAEQEKYSNEWPEWPPFNEREIRYIERTAMHNEAYLKDPKNDFLSIPSVDFDAAAAKSAYSELYRWNHSTHQEILETLEEPFLGLSDRIAQFAFERPGVIKSMARQPQIDRVPYAVAALPPQLFEHTADPDHPALPVTAYEIAKLSSAAAVHAQRIQAALSVWSLAEPHEALSVHGRDGLLQELWRRRTTGNDTLQTDKGQRQWREYRNMFIRQYREGRTSLIENANFVNYHKNRRATELGGFFEHVTEEFESYFLMDTDSNSLFTSQLRAPVGAYGPRFAERLIRAAGVMTKLIQSDKQLQHDVLQKAENPETKALLETFIMRIRSVKNEPKIIDGTYHTALEAVSSVTALLNLLMAEGVPGYENDPDGGLAWLLTNNIPSKATAILPQAVTVPSTLYGRYFADILKGDATELYINPAVVGSLMRIHDQRTVLLHHPQWRAYLDGEATTSPVRMGLRCPFKGKVTRNFTETLAVIYGMLA